MEYKEVFGEELATQIETIIKEKGLNLIVDSKEKPAFIPKSRFDEVIGSKNELKTQVSELTNNLETLKKSAQGNEELTKAIQELQSKNGEWETRYKKSLIENTVKFKALQEKAKDTQDLLKFLDYDKLELDPNGDVKGIDEQIKALKENKAYLFDTVDTTKNNNPLNPPNAGGNKLSLKDKYNEAYLEVSKNPNNTALLQRLFNLKKELHDEQKQ